MIEPMAKFNPCKICGKPASIHVTQIMGNQMTKADICQYCAQEKGILTPNGFPSAAALGQQLLLLEESLKMIMKQVSCSTCGYKLEAFKKTGNLGCPSCYETFSSVLEFVIKEAQHHTEHKGKKAARSLQHTDLTRRLSTLESELKQAIQDERFEDAAHMRDEILAVKASLELHAL